MINLLQKKQKGIGLLELMLSLVIIALLLIMAARYYITTRNKNFANMVVKEVETLYSAGQSYLSDIGRFPQGADLIPEFIQYGFYPDNKTSWNGNVQAKCEQASGKILTITFDHVPYKVCTEAGFRLLTKFNTSGTSCSKTGSMIVTVQ